MLPTLLLSVLFVLFRVLYFSWPLGGFRPSKASLLSDSRKPLFLRLCRIMSYLFVMPYILMVVIPLPKIQHKYIKRIVNLWRALFHRCLKGTNFAYNRCDSVSA